MSEINLSKISNLLSETEIKEENWSAKVRDNLNKLWSRDNEILRDRLAKVEKEMIAQKMLKNKVENLRKEILDLNARDEISEDKISEFKSLLNETDNEVRRQQTEEKKLKQHYESRKMELGKLEKVKNLLRTHQSLYDYCLSTRLCCEDSDVFKLSLMDSEKCMGWIKFEYREDENYFQSKY
ncbi:hypothetical protein V9T40_008048 [Parthenolecanium corni]|uniref:Uncharacterized protein n=1 Tax=Parthenolecanium corni TaxID=536013 RepID=A0AAN9TZY6_9HEMI